MTTFASLIPQRNLPSAEILAEQLLALTSKDKSNETGEQEVKKLLGEIQQASPTLDQFFILVSDATAKIEAEDDRRFRGGTQNYDGYSLSALRNHLGHFVYESLDRLLVQPFIEAKHALLSSIQRGEDFIVLVESSRLLTETFLSRYVVYDTRDVRQSDQVDKKDIRLRSVNDVASRISGFKYFKHRVGWSVHSAFMADLPADLKGSAYPVLG